ncbi:MAG TPA: RNA polymerase sigma factor [Verrucomicrobiae bacterium]|jgi:RNA polymerase sigma-70 factor (ECF subfamily)|nr:RNA polymerase sigma factor [Verrucomicrobiae bacterium]
MDLAHIYREEWGRILAILIRQFGSFELAEEVAQEAFTVALEQWPREGVPQNPRAWLIATARHKAIDYLRRARRMDLKESDELVRLADERGEIQEEETMRDERLSLVFTCCHPALAVESQVALTLRTLGGLTTEEIAKAFLVPVPTMAQRLVRTKNKIRSAHIPYCIPAKQELVERLDAVLLVIYLIFNEGYAARSGDSLVRRELCHDAISLGRVLCELLPSNAEARSLLALMLLHDSRRNARSTDGNLLVPLEEQDRSLWDREQIREGVALTESALRAGDRGPYSLQAAIAALHAQAGTAGETDWQQIAALYRLLLIVHPSPVVELNRAVAIAMAQGPHAGLRLLDELEKRGELSEYYLLPAARADLLRRSSCWAEAAEAYRSALKLDMSGPERQYLARRLDEVEQLSSPAPADRDL